LAKQARAYEILFEDEDLLVINKSAGFPVLPERQNQLNESIKGLVERKYEKVFIVHRIDRDTSGILCLAKNADAHKAMNKLFLERKVEKKYLAIVDGILPEAEGKIDLAIFQDKNKNRIDPKGKASLSLYKTLEQFRHYALVEVDLKTGRQHQIRLHMRAIGNPLMVDEKYGEREAFFLSSIKKKFNRKDGEERALLNRLSLHAHSLTFKHPSSNETISLSAPLPKDLLATLNQLRKWDS
jgi:23S rRNA pseudouridine955/2504/2580 synthase/23S rRNA pseudouridine1911/1915/1917 synthase